jgi:hypothetical protein
LHQNVSGPGRIFEEPYAKNRTAGRVLKKKRRTKAGLTTVKWAKAAIDDSWFMQSFREAASSARAIRFDLKSFEAGYPTAGLTKRELDYILNNKELLKKTKFTMKGEEVVWDGAGFIPKPPPVK